VVGMSKLNETAANQGMMARATRALEVLASLALRRGFYGTVAIEMILQDGTIQKVRSRIERDEK
jgi:hypothetical protein